MDYSSFDKIPLPKANRHETLEDLSRNKLAPLFDGTLFELRDVTKRDKGIDLFIELKRNDIHTNFRFAVQLKATDSVTENIDGSYSWPIEASNINYLLNESNSAYYVLYLKKQDKFLFESVNTFYIHLEQKSADWQQQKHHTLRFKRELDETAVQEIYEHVFAKGFAQRKINDSLNAYAVSNTAQSHKVAIDSNHEVYDDKQIQELIETSGFFLLNDGRWKDILAFHKQGSRGMGEESPVYNLIVGTAFYHTGKNVDALSCFKQSKKHMDKLPENLVGYLTYFHLTTRFTIGLLTKDAYDSQIQLLESDSVIGLYQKIKNITKVRGTDIYTEYKRIIPELKKVLNHPQADDNIKLIVRCEMLLWDGHKMNTDYEMNKPKVIIPQLATQLTTKEREKILQDILNADQKWEKQSGELIEDAKSQDNLFARIVARFHIITIKYDFIAYENTLCFYAFNNPRDVILKSLEHVEYAKLLLQDLQVVEFFYRSLDDIENLCVVLSKKYELLHFIKDHKKTKEAIGELLFLVEDYDLKEAQEKVEILQNRGTQHEMKVDFYANMLRI
ncbi:DUF4365 domain-containing protein [uncultured Microscilla sp.]|uniref:DUF4365 domain-containing protein n=1 Tax=uncultured Microscilla sp. TaxID=432653 RepID=UPI0026044ADF|nr:DUF4365 domain-containing protein [uncultured Microscilla sp.]